MQLLRFEVLGADRFDAAFREYLADLGVQASRRRRTSSA